MTVEAAGVLSSYMLLVHKFLVEGLLEVGGLVVAGLTVFLFDPPSIQDQSGFQAAFFEKGLVTGCACGLDYVVVAAAAGDLGLFEDLMGDRFLPGSLNRFLRELVAEFAAGAAFIKFGVLEMAEVAGAFAYLEFFLGSFVLVAAGTV